MNPSTLAGFLDEIGDMPLDLQPKLLHVLRASPLARQHSRAPKTTSRVVSFSRMMESLNQHLSKAIGHWNPRFPTPHSKTRYVALAMGTRKCRCPQARNTRSDDNDPDTNDHGHRRGLFDRER